MEKWKWNGELTIRLLFCQRLYLKFGVLTTWPNSMLKNELLKSKSNWKKKEKQEHLEMQLHISTYSMG